MNVRGSCAIWVWSHINIFDWINIPQINRGTKRVKKMEVQELKTVMTNSSCKLLCKVLVSTLFSALVSYYFMIVDGYTCLDGMCM